MAVDINDDKSWLVNYDWNSDSKTVQLWQIKGFSSNPNADQWTAHSDSIIYATNSDSDNFPVRGYIVGRTTSLWGYSECVAPDFGINTGSYEQLYTSPRSNANLGLLSRIEMDAKSCKNEDVIAIEVNGYTGLGRNDIDALYESTKWSREESKMFVYD